VHFWDWAFLCTLSALSSLNSHIRHIQVKGGERWNIPKSIRICIIMCSEENSHFIKGNPLRMILPNMSFNEVKGCYKGLYKFCEFKKIKEKCMVRLAFARHWAHWRNVSETWGVTKVGGVGVGRVRWQFCLMSVVSHMAPQKWVFDVIMHETQSWHYEQMWLDLLIYFQSIRVMSKFMYIY